MDQDQKAPAPASTKSPERGSDERSFIVGLWGVRYQVRDVARSIDFYTQRLGFKLDAKHLPAFGQVSIGNLKLILSGPGASGSRPLPDGRQQQPGGWNRVVLANARNEANAKYNGKSIAVIAAEQDKDPADAAFDLVAQGQGRVMAIYHMMTEPDVETALRFKWTSIGSDAGAIRHRWR